MPQGAQQKMEILGVLFTFSVTVNIIILDLGS